MWFLRLPQPPEDYKPLGFLVTTDKPGLALYSKLELLYLWNSDGEGVEAYDLEYIAGNRATVYSSKSGHASFPHPGCYIQGSPKLRRGIRNDAAMNIFDELPVELYGEEGPTGREMEEVQQLFHMHLPSNPLALTPNSTCANPNSDRQTDVGKKIYFFVQELPKFSNFKYLDEGKSKSFGRKAVTFVLVTVTGGVALSALDDLAIYHGCSSKAMEKASNSQAIKDAIGEPIVKGPWYNASLAVAHKRQSVSCTFPVSGPHGNGVFQLKAVRNGDDGWFSFFLPRNWEILIMEALLHIPSNEERQQTMRISLSDSFSSPASRERCRITEPTVRLEAEADNNQNSQFAYKNLNISQIKEDGDKHLPLVERARVRMGKQSSLEEEHNNFTRAKERRPNEVAFNAMEEDNSFFQPEKRTSFEAGVNTLEPISSSSNCNSDIVANRDSLVV
ncbi:hypothetical protein D5086_005459 [Populus alba]|uniref:Uncharacterized protein n=1 Tax=Populus alba TaxID=43335 RepID=A0ACC4CTA8_POPAL